MRSTLITILSCLFFFLHAGGNNNYYAPYLFPRPDTIPPPPNGQPNPLAGPSSACVGESSEYAIDVPVACSCQWSVNGIIQPESGSPFIISWTQSGQQVISVVFLCPNGQASDPESIIVAVSEVPQAQPISGDNPVCEYTYHTYSTIVGPYDSCEWTVNGVIQPGYSPSINYSFGATGAYLFEVIAFNSCGTGNPTFKNVLVLYQPDVFLGNDTTILQGQTLLLDAGNPGSDYLWSTGETTQTLPVSVSGVYAVNVSNFCGAGADTIEVSVFVDINESTNLSGCFSLNVQKRKINLTDLPPGPVNISVINISGMTCYDGPAAGEITVAHPGIYLIRVISAETICYKKVFIP